MDVFAQLAGFFSLLKFIFSIFIIPYESFMQKIYLINSYILKKKENSNDNFKNTKSIEKLNMFSILFDNNKRQLYSNLSKKIEKLLDITEVIFNPLKFQANIIEIQGSLQRFENEKIRASNNTINNVIDVIPQDERAENIYGQLSKRIIDEELPTPFLNQKSEIPFRRLAPTLKGNQQT